MSMYGDMVETFRTMKKENNWTAEKFITILARKPLKR